MGYTDPELEAKWDAWERRNPGVAHPDRVKHRADAQRKARAQEYADATERFRPQPKTLAQQGADARRSQRRF